MPTVILYPNFDGTKTNISGSVDTTNLYANIDEGTASPDDADHLLFGAAGANYFCGFQDLPAEAYSVTGVTFRVRTSDSSKGRKIDSIQLYQSDESTAITGSSVISGSTTATTYSISPAITGSSSPSVWNNARVRVGGSSGSGFPALYALQIEVTYETEPSTRTLLTDLSGFWKLNEASGSRVDLSGNSNTLSDNSSVGSASSEKGTVAAFTSSSNQFLSISSNSTLDLASTSFSVSLWVRFTSLTNNGSNDYVGIISKGSGGASYTFSIQYRPSVPCIQAQIYNGGTTNSVNATSFGAIVAGKWYHVAFTFNSLTKKMSLYINGVSNTATATVIPADVSYSMSIGRAYHVNTYNSNIQVSTVALWKRLLSDYSIMALYNAGQTLQYPMKPFNSGSTIM